MKILHVCLGCFYIDNFSYQENMIPKFHKKMGYDVEILASTLSFDSSGDACNVEAKSYINEYGIKVTRVPYKKGLPQKIGKFFRVYEGVKEEIENIKPDILFIHGCQFCDIRYVVEYAKQYKVRIYVDNHADFSNSARNWVSKNIMHKVIWKHCAQLILPYVTKFYGVLPARVDFLKDMYNIPQEKVELLVMGADDDMIEEVKRENRRNQLRNQYGIKDTDFLIITGGKIDHAKEQVIQLLEAIRSLNIEKVKCIVFGSIVDDMKEKILSFCDNENIIYVGWLDNKKTYEYLYASDLAIYPGRHSVLWEQTVGLGIPMITKYWEGTTHIDVGGNVKFIQEDSVKEMKLLITDMLNSDEYLNMKSIAQLKGIKEFSYAYIAGKSIE